jgi:hypothetical protein
MQDILSSLYVTVSLLGTLVSQQIQPSTAYAEAPIPVQVEIPAILKEIGRCESGNRQFEDDGSVLRGKVNPKDVGKFQINEYWHLETSKKMGIDIHTEEGNTVYALYLLKTQGTKPWDASAYCWKKKK